VLFFSTLELSGIVVDIMASKEIIRLDELKSLYGEDSVRELLELSLGEARTLISSLEIAVPAKNQQAVSADAHQLKGMAATMTIDRLAELSKELEFAAKDNIWDDSPRILSDISKTFIELEQYLKTAFPL
jgi:HPt (histidine-containing phosphotransfer) domain-containing protein